HPDVGRSVRRLHQAREREVPAHRRADRHQARVDHRVIASEAKQSHFTCAWRMAEIASSRFALLAMTQSVGQSIFVTVTRVPALTTFSAFTSLSALAKTLHGLASRVSPPLEIGVRPKPMAIAGPSGQ